MHSSAKQRLINLRVAIAPSAIDQTSLAIHQMPPNANAIIFPASSRSQFCPLPTSLPASQVPLSQVNQLGISTHVVYSSNSGSVSFKCHRVCGRNAVGSSEHQSIGASEVEPTILNTPLANDFLLNYAAAPERKLWLVRVGKGPRKERESETTERS